MRHEKNQTSGSFIVHLMFIIHRLAVIYKCLIVGESVLSLCQILLGLMQKMFQLTIYIFSFFLFVL